MRPREHFARFNYYWDGSIQVNDRGTLWCLFLFFYAHCTSIIQCRKVDKAGVDKLQKQNVKNGKFLIRFQQNSTPLNSFPVTEPFSCLEYVHILKHVFWRGISLNVLLLFVNKLSMIYDFSVEIIMARSHI